MGLYQSYLICTTPRSGSTLLCKLLAATGKAGYPDSHFHSPSISDWMGYYGISPEKFATERELLIAIFKAAHVRGMGHSGIFGLRLQKNSFDYFLQKLRVLYPDQSSDSKRIQVAFGKTLIIHLVRRNKLDQAISYVKATQTGLWHKAPDGTELERLSAPAEPEYDADAIARHMAELTSMDVQWNSWFVKEGVDPVIIRYDDLSDDPTGVLGELLVHLGLDREIASDIVVPVAKLADATNSRWARRFLAAD